MSGVVGAGLLACTLTGNAGATTEISSEALAATFTATEPAATGPADEPTATPPGAAEPAETTAPDTAVGAPAGAFDAFLDRLMRAESNGRNTAANPRSTALGPFQFIRSTFLAVMHRHFSADVAHLSETDILALRTDRGFARRAAAAFSKENLDYLADRGLKPTFGHLRLAFLLGPVGAARVMQAPPTKLVSHILDDRVISANPFMRGMRAADLIARAHRDVGADTASVRVADAGAAAAAGAGAAAPQSASGAGATEPAAAPPEPAARPQVAARPAVRTHSRSHSARSEHGSASARTAVINVKCNPKLASCQRWINQQIARLGRVADSARRDRHGA